jgi:hypothetical protein
MFVDRFDHVNRNTIVQCLIDRTRDRRIHHVAQVENFCSDATQFIDSLHQNRCCLPDEIGHCKARLVYSGIKLLARLAPGSRLVFVGVKFTDAYRLVERDLDGRDRFLLIPVKTALSRRSRVQLFFFRCGSFEFSGPGYRFSAF